MPDDVRASARPLRPLLPDVLGALTAYPADRWRAPDLGRVLVEPGGVRVAAWPSVAPWTVDDVAAAVERLIVADVLPQSWADDASSGRRLWRVERGADAYGGEPRTLAELIAWVSLGAPQIAQAEELARDAVRRLAPWRVAAREPRVVWTIHRSSRGGLPPGWPTLSGAVDVEAWVRAFLAADAARAIAPWWAAHVKAWPADAPPCPHAPVLELLRMGLDLVELRVDELVLGCPPLTS